MTTWRGGIVCAAVLVAACGGASSTVLDSTDPGTDGGGGGDDAGVDSAVPPTDAGTDGTTPLACAQGTANCDGNPANGCETNTLADDGHCGGCAAANACASGSSCQAGACVVGPATVVLAGTFSVNDSTCIGIDLSFVYVGSGKANGDVYRVSKAGGTPISIATGQGNPRGIATDATSVYWASFGSGILTRANPDGSNASPFNTGAAGSNTIDVDAVGIYWGNAQLGTVSRVDKNGMNAKQLAPAAGTLGANHVANIAVATGFVYFTDPGAGQVMRVPRDGSAVPSLVATLVPNARGLAVMGATVLFTTSSGGGSVMSVAGSGPPAVPAPIATAQGNPVSVTTDGTAAYWANGGATGGIMKRAPGGAVVPLATAQAFPTCIAVDGSSVYWINQSGAAVMRVAK